MTGWKNARLAGLLAVALMSGQASLANGVAGDYLAARQASFTGDYRAAAQYYGRAIMFDPANPQLLERAILANLSLADLERAAGLADKLGSEGFASQLGQIALVARDASSENYAAVVQAIDDNRGVGPLGDALVKAWAQMGQGDMSSALVSFDEAAKMQGMGPFSIYHKALALASVGDFESAETIFAGDATGGMNMTRRGVMARAEILSQMGRTDEALDLLGLAFGKDLDPGLAALKSALETGDALPFSHIRSARDGIAEVFYTLASALENEQGDDIALLYARVAESLRPDLVAAILLAAEQLDRRDQHDLAVEVYSKVPVDHPSFHAAELGRAEAYRAAGDLDKAEDVLKTLTQSHGDLPAVYSSYADLLRQLEKNEEAAAAYTKALDLYTEETDRQWFLYYARGIVHHAMDDWPSAETDFRKALELNPDQPNVLNFLGYSLVERKSKLDEALGMIERAVAARPNSGYIVDSLGWVLYRLGRYDEAVGHMERAAELMPIDPIVNDHLGDVYWAVGRSLEAEFMWKRALSFVDWEDASEEADPDRIRRKLEVGLDQVLAEEGAPPLQVANDAND